MAFVINSVVRGYHIYKDIGASIGVLKLIQSYHAVQSLVIVKTGSYAVAAMNGTHVYHVPRKYLLFIIYFYVISLSEIYFRREAVTRNLFSTMKLSSKYPKIKTLRK